MVHDKRDQRKTVEKPTYMEHIRFFFDECDINHMKEMGIDLSTYEGVKSKATSIYFQTKPPSASMPPQRNRKWSDARSKTFGNWIRSGCPRGIAKAKSINVAFAKKATRIRKDIRVLKKEELNKLKKAFNGIVARDPRVDNSYFALAGIHWLPEESGLDCLHHEGRYNPWHRIYLRKFEDALRSVEGCGDVTLPYWDVTSPLPEVLNKPPFASYTLPRDVGKGFNKNYVTQRYSSGVISRKVKYEFNIPEKIATAEAQSFWEGFNKNIWEAHDSGHVSCGPTMQLQEVTAFDPLFWFFHANWDRLWWKWQEAVDATSQQKFRSTVIGSTEWLDTPPFNNLKPFKETADQSIEIGDIAYIHPEKEEALVFVALGQGRVAAKRAFSIPHPQKISIRVKGIDRLKIPGTFTVHLRADGETFARQGFFQPMKPKSCDNCRERGIVDIDFIQDIKDIRNRILSVGIRLEGEEKVSGWFPLTSCGSPTVNIRHLIQPN